MHIHFATEPAAAAHYNALIAEAVAAGKSDAYIATLLRHKVGACRRVQAEG